MMATFEPAVEELLGHEGGYGNDPDDPGGETHWGISKRRYPYVNIQSLTREEAIGIYRLDWWEEYRYGLVRDQRIANKLLAMSVNAGPAIAHRLMQESLNYLGMSLVVDGILGPRSRAAINSVDAGLLVNIYRVKTGAWYMDLGKLKYLEGWLNRALA